jgi:hypothetical protein
VVAVGYTWTEDRDDLITLEEARALPAPYFVGEAFEGLPLTVIVGPDQPVTFIYGDCDRQPNPKEDFGCTSPLQNMNETMGQRWPGDFSPTLPCRRVAVRGVPAVFVGNNVGRDLGLVVYMGDRIITIYGDPVSRMLRAAEALRPVDAERATTEDLPQPTVDASGLARCS